MAFTQNDVDSVEQAIRDMTNGQRVGTARSADGTTIIYDMSATLADLVKMRSFLTAQVAIANPPAGQVLPSAPIKAIRISPRTGYCW